MKDFRMKEIQLNMDRRTHKSCRKIQHGILLPKEIKHPLFPTGFVMNCERVWKNR